VFNSDGTIKTLNTWFPRLPLQRHASAPGMPVWYDASLTYEGSSYSFAALLYGPQSFELSSYCLTAHGVALSCDELTAAIREVWNSEPAVQNLICGPEADGLGCVCNYDMVLNTGPAGSWAAGGSLITHFDAQKGPAFQANYAVSGNRLSLSGYHRTSLFGQEGLRALELARVVCTDGLHGPGEDGPDCGPYCASPCP
jgi:hypothetical protein